MVLRCEERPSPLSAYLRRSYPPKRDIPDNESLMYDTIVWWTPR
jgi:hypothetical protein